MSARQYCIKRSTFCLNYKIWIASVQSASIIATVELLLSHPMQVRPETGAWRDKGRPAAMCSLNNSTSPNNSSHSGDTEHEWRVNSFINFSYQLSVCRIRCQLSCGRFAVCASCWLPTKREKNQWNLEPEQWDGNRRCVGGTMTGPLGWRGPQRIKQEISRPTSEKLATKTVYIHSSEQLFCYRQKNAWSLSALILFKLHDIW